MKKLLLWLLPALFALVLPALAPAQAGQLDRSFAGTGKVTAFLEPPDPDRAAPEAHLAWAGRGKIVVAAGRTLAEYLPNGRLNRSFGDGGRLRVEPEPGSDVDLAGVAVDSRGRILVAGTTRPSQWSAAGFVARYLADGRPDRSFGNGGTVLTTLGLPAPPKPPNPHPLQPVPPIEGPFVRFLGLAVDAADRPVLSGAWTRAFTLCYPFLN
ncbi:MAG TPA: delta-60 repeat domain-containing protein, partial [Solirubrobacterales bacterium]|nr:delta-60 repeat domain-containing protein [Solirubrobacterales bacterium]